MKKFVCLLLLYIISVTCAWANNFESNTRKEINSVRYQLSKIKNNIYISNNKFEESLLIEQKYKMSLRDFDRDMYRNLNVLKALAKRSHSSVKRKLNFKDKVLYLSSLSYLKCLANLNNNLSIKNCHEPHRKHDLLMSLMPKISKLKKKLEVSKDDIEKAIYSVQNDRRQVISLLVELRKKENQLKIQYTSLLDKDREISLRAEIDEHKARYAKFYNCNEDGYTLDLENETIHNTLPTRGPFYKLQRDSQGALGTCYANTAKNLIVGITKGDSIASFLDLAAIYKENTASLESLDGGFTCKVLDLIKEKGYCPQSYSPLEKNSYSVNKTFYMDTDIIDFLYRYHDQSSELELVYRNLDSFWNEFDDRLIKTGTFLVDKVGSPLDSNLYSNLYKWNYLTSLSEGESKVSEPSFIAELDAAQIKFYEKLLDLSDSEDHLDPERVKNIFHTVLKNTINKYSLNAKFKEGSLLSLKLEYFFKKLTKRSFLHEYTTVLRGVLLGRGQIEQLYKDGIYDEHFLKVFASEMRFRRLVAQNGLSVSGRDIKGMSKLQFVMSVAAPKCLDQRNRKNIETPFSCQSLDTKKNKGVIHDRIIMSLIKGLPVGNTFPTGALTSHINTIVGSRFYQGKCEYKIRESQNGTSSWHSRDTIIQKMSDITIVER